MDPLERAYTYRPVADLTTARRIGILGSNALRLAQSVAAFLPASSPARDQVLSRIESAYTEAARAIESRGGR
jgi:hypothetical protein